VSACEHRYVYAGVRYADGNYNLPGSGARRRYYAHWYYCEKCLAPHVEKIQGVEDNSYLKVKFDATPGDPKLLIPIHDRSRF
jgi:hypothetical protein